MESAHACTHVCTHVCTQARRHQANQPTNQPTSQPTSQPSQPASQPGIFTCIFMKSLFRMTIHRDEQRTMTLHRRRCRGGAWSVDRRRRWISSRREKEGRERVPGTRCKKSEKGEAYTTASSLRTHVDARDTLVRCHGSFLRSFVDPFVRLSVRPSVRPSVRSFVRSFVHTFVHTYTLVGWFVRSVLCDDCR